MHLGLRFDSDDWTRLIWYHDPNVQFLMGLRVIQTNLDMQAILEHAGKFPHRKVHIILQDREAIVAGDRKTLLYAIPLAVLVPVGRFDYEKHHLAALQSQKKDNKVLEEELGWLEKTGQKWYITDNPVPE